MDINTAIALHQSGRLAEAQAAYEAVLAQTPADANARHRFTRELEHLLRQQGTSRAL